MAHLVKINDYYSKYEQDFYQYPGYIIQRKKSEWKQYEEEWKRVQQTEISLDDWGLGDSKEKRFWKLPLFFKPKRVEKDYEEERAYSLFPTYVPNSAEELKHYFLDHWYSKQIQLVCSEESEAYTFAYDRILKFLVTEFSDQYLLFYKPYYRTKDDSTIELESIMITPLEVWIIHWLKVPSNAVVRHVNKRYWEYYYQKERIQMINPLNGLKRTEQVVKGMMKKENITLPVRTILMNNTAYINPENLPYGLLKLDQESFQSWFEENKRCRVPLKSAQMKIAQALLHVSTLSQDAGEWHE